MADKLTEEEVKKFIYKDSDKIKQNNDINESSMRDNIKRETYAFIPHDPERKKRFSLFSKIYSAFRRARDDIEDK